MTATLSNEKMNVENRQEIASGEMPATTLFGGQIYVSFIKKEKERRNIKLSIK